MKVADAMIAIASTLRPGRSVVLRTPRRRIDGGCGLPDAARSLHVIRHRQASSIAAPAPKNAPAGSIAFATAARINPTAVSTKNTPPAFAPALRRDRPGVAPAALRRPEPMSVRTVPDRRLRSEMRARP